MPTVTAYLSRRIAILRMRGELRPSYAIRVIAVTRTSIRQNVTRFSLD